MKATDVPRRYTGRKLRVVKAYIRVSRCDRIEGGYFFDLRIEAVFPRCRTRATVSYSPGVRAICCRNLYSCNSEAHIHPYDWWMLCRNAPVVSDRYQPVEMSPELAEKARAHAASMAECQAIENAGDACAAYLEAQTWDELDFAPGALTVRRSPLLRPGLVPARYGGYPWTPGDSLLSMTKRLGKRLPTMTAAEISALADDLAARRVAARPKEVAKC